MGHMYTIREISKDEYWRFLRTYPGASFQQTPEWGDARRAQWAPQLVGWFDAESHLCAAAVLRYRRVPGVGRWFVFIPQGPLFDWTAPHVAEQLTALGTYLRSHGVFGVRITPVVSLRTWGAATIKAGFADPEIDRLSALEPSEVNPGGTRLVSTMRAAGWREAPDAKHSDDSHPRFNCWLDLFGRSEAEVLAGMSKSCRKNIRKVERTGLTVAVGSRGDLDDAYRLHEETARRNKFAAYPESYFHALWDTLGNGFPGHFNLYVAHYEGRAVAANAMAQVGGWAQGVFAASSTGQTHTKPSSALHWAEIQQALADGAGHFDLGGVEDTLDEHDPAAGLVRFKAALGADAHEYIGAWDLPLQPRLYSAFTRLLPLYAAAAAQLRRVAAPRAATLSRG